MTLLSNAQRVPWILVAMTIISAPAAQTPRVDLLRQMVPAEAGRAKTIAFGDVDADGDMDAFVGNEFSPSHLLLNTGYGRFQLSTSSLPAGLPNPSDAVFLDVDADGDLDLFLLVFARQSRLLINDGKGVFRDATATLLPIEQDAGTAVAFGDVDGDKDLDLLIAIDGTWSPRQSERLYLNDGRGRFINAMQKIPTNFDLANSVALGDVDGDGDLDAVLATRSSSGGQPNRLYLNDGSGVFTAPSTGWPSTAGQTQDVLLADIDGDRDLDFIAINSDSGGGAAGQDHIFKNNGRGVFVDATAASLPALPEQGSAGAVADVDEDGDLDLFIAQVNNRGGRQNRLLMNDGSGRFLDVTLQALPELLAISFAVAFADVDGDGDRDAFVGNQFTQNTLLLNDGAGKFMDATAPALPAGGSTSAVAIRDFDGDRFLDIYSAGIRQNRLLLGDGSGRFRDVTNSHVPTGSHFGLSVASGDVDGDGDIDVLEGNQHAPVQLFLNDGFGRFSDASATNLPRVPAIAFVVLLADIDADGDLDAFIGQTHSQTSARQNRLLRNNGAGKFTDVTSTHMPSNREWTLSAAFGDVDGDRDLDLIVGNAADSRNQQARLLINNGAGVFSDQSWRLSGVLARIRTAAVALVDVDGDDDLDVIVGAQGNAQSDGQTRLWLNDGRGRFSNGTAQMPIDRADTRSIAVGDLDGDGDADLVLGNNPTLRPPGTRQVYLNDGTGRFSAHARPGPSEYVGCVEILDIDGDGDNDVFTGTGIRDRIFTNTTRQIAMRELSGPGKRALLDIYGPPGGGFGVCLTAGRNYVRTAIGLLLVDPQTSVVGAQGGLDPSGRATIEFAIPEDRSLIGRVGYWQGVIGPSPRFSNLEIMRINPH